ncbi:magnesium chelatase domain-containing protein [Aureliella helgolandensis]|uniref:magnesium chelatase domain-containing protein n=1 Tax=Aureliella helgolandensis TaxID=2527968 RepID=UPI003703BCFC
MVKSGFKRPNVRVVVNLVPAKHPKQAATFDLPSSLGILASSSQLVAGYLQQPVGIKRTGFRGAYAE